MIANDSLGKVTIDVMLMVICGSYLVCSTIQEIVSYLGYKSLRARLASTAGLSKRKKNYNKKERKNKMKNSEEILKGLECCSSEKRLCGECPYNELTDEAENITCDERLMKDAAQALTETKEMIKVKEEATVCYISPFRCTVDGMLSPDYKERFKAEYQQTKIRYEKLKAFCNRIEAARRTNCGLFVEAVKKAEAPKHDCPEDLLREQQSAMGQYLHILEIRAVIEGIEL